VHAEALRILHAQDEQRLYIHCAEKRRVVVAVRVVVLIVFMVEDSSVSKEAERKSRDAC
jgi:hypothetical protein